MLGQRVRSLHRSFIRAPVGTASDRAVSSLLSTTEEAGAMRGSCQLHRLFALQPQGVENHQQTYWQVWRLLPRVPRLSKFHRLAIGEERGTQD